MPFKIGWWLAKWLGWEGWQSPKGVQTLTSGLHNVFTVFSTVWAANAYANWPRDVPSFWVDEEEDKEGVQEKDYLHQKIQILVVSCMGEWKQRPTSKQRGRSKGRLAAGNISQRSTEVMDVSRKIVIISISNVHKAYSQLCCYSVHFNAIEETGGFTAEIQSIIHTVIKLTFISRRNCSFL